MQHHDDYMRQAIEIAITNPRAPFGTVLVDEETGRVVGTGVNRTSESPVLHGEVDAIHRYAKEGDGRWSQLRLYTTAEPCCMCQAAIIWAGIPQVVFGTSISRLMELGWNQIGLTATQVVDRAAFATCVVIGGVLTEECDRLFAQAKS